MRFKGPRDRLSETAVPRWTEATDLFWQPTVDTLASSRKTIVIGTTFDIPAKPGTKTGSRFEALRRARFPAHPRARGYVESVAVIKCAAETVRTVFHHHWPPPGSNSHLLRAVLDLADPNYRLKPTWNPRRRSERLLGGFYSHPGAPMGALALMGEAFACSHLVGYEHLGLKQ